MIATRICIVLLVIIFLVLVRSCYENRNFTVTNYTYSTDKLNDDIRILMIADLHNVVFGRDNAGLYKAIEEKCPDMIIIAGDVLVCNKKQKHPGEKTLSFINSLSDIAPVFYGMGNHEYGAMQKMYGVEELWSEYTDSLDKRINLLDNESAKIKIKNSVISIHGLTLDRSYFTRFKKKKLDMEYIYDRLGAFDEGFNILIAHNPDYFEEYSDTGADIVLSGHNHGGVMRLPLFGGVISPRGRVFPRYDCGRFDRNSTTLFLTRGLGSHSLRIRFNNMPEVVVIDISCKGNRNNII